MHAGDRILAVIMPALLAAAAIAALGAQQPDQAVTPAAPSLTDQFQGLEFRSIGPFRGGRVTAVAGQSARCPRQ